MYAIRLYIHIYNFIYTFFYKKYKFIQYKTIKKMNNSIQTIYIITSYLNA